MEEDERKVLRGRSVCHRISIPPLGIHVISDRIDLTRQAQYSYLHNEIVTKDQLTAFSNYSVSLPLSQLKVYHQSIRCVS